MRKSIELTHQTVGKVRWAIFAYFFLAGLCFSSWASRIPDIKNALSLDDATWGSMLLLIPLGQICGMTFSGKLIAKVGSKRILLGAMIGYSLSLVWVALAPERMSFIAGLVSFGFFANFCNIAVNTQGVTIETFCRKQVMATFHGGWSLAGLFGGIVGLGMTLMSIPTTIHFSVVAVIILSGSAVCYAYLQPDPQADTQPEQSTSKPSRIEPFLLLLGIVGFFGMAAEGAMTDWNGVYLESVVGVAEHLTPLGLSAYMITMATGRFMVDRATGRWGRKRILQACGCFIFTGMSLTVLFPTLPITLVAFMLVGFGTCGIVPTLYSVAGRKTSMHTGRALTILSSVSFMGFLLGPPLIGYISQATNLRYSYAVIGLLGLCIVAMSSRLKVLRDE